jgi:hypothetical protein
MKTFEASMNQIKQKCKVWFQKNCTNDRVRFIALFISMPLFLFFLLFIAASALTGALIVKWYQWIIGKGFVIFFFIGCLRIKKEQEAKRGEVGNTLFHFGLMLTLSALLTILFTSCSPLLKGNDLNVSEFAKNGLLIIASIGANLIAGALTYKEDEKS